MNHYKDQEEDLEKYKLICRFINPEGAEKFFNKPDEDKSRFTPENELIDIIAKNRNINPEELRDKLHNPKDYDDNLDTIERIS